MKRRRFASLLGVALLAGPVAAKSDDPYPSRMVKLIIALPAGSGSDGLTRFFAKRMQELTGQPFAVENKPGANSFIAADTIIRMPADGYTLTLASNSMMASNAALFKKMPYDPIDDFTPVARIARAPNIVIVPAASPYKSLADLIAAGRTRPNGLSFAAASGSHNIATFALMQLANFEAVSVPYQGPPKALLDTAAGLTDFMLIDVAAAVPLMQSGRLRPLAVTTTKRHPSYPEVPTVTEAGVPGFEYSSWAGIFAPVHTPPAVIEKIAALAKQIMAEPETTAYFERTGTEPFWASANELRRFQLDEIDWWRSTMRRAGLEAQ